MLFVPVIPYVDPSRKMIDVISSLGLTSGLQLCLDAGDATSYTSGQVWTDRSGNGYNFNRGSGSGSDGADPTFNGSAGGDSSSEYWSFDGADYFTLGQANPTWVNNIHKNNALVTFAAWVYIASMPGTQQFLAGTFNPTASPMFEWGIASSQKNFFSVGDGSGSAIFTSGSSANVPTGAWTFLAVSVDEAANSLVLQINATQESKACTYPGPSSSNAGNIIKIGADGDGALAVSSGSRCANFSAWNTALSAGSLANLYNATKSKFGL